MLLSFIGMSGAGKTYWSRKLQDEKGFQIYCCDDLIEAKLAPTLKKLGLQGIQDVAKWMGQPYEARFEKNQQQYLDMEIEVMQEIIAKIKKERPQNTVIDTTGSVTYTGEELCRELRNYTEIIYLKVTDEYKQEMYRQYLREPKPVVWGNSFSKNSIESRNEALSRCYPILLNYRQSQYEKYAHQKIPYHKTREKNFTADDFLSLIKKLSSRI